MTGDEVRALIAQGEGPSTALRGEAVKPGKLAETLMAFANAEGGIVLVGVDGATRHVPGVRQPAEVHRRAIEASLLCDPPLIIPLPETVTLEEGQPVVVITVPKGLPHVYNVSGRYLGRFGSLNKPLRPDELKRLLIQRAEISFDALPVKGTTIEDLDTAKVRRYVANFRGAPELSAEDILLNRGCVTKEGDGLVPTTAGILLFGKNPERFFRHADITLVRYPGTAPGDEFLREDIRKTLPELIREAEIWLVANMRKGSRLSGLDRQDFTEYPVEAVREAVVNAVAHRDYSIRGDNIRVTMFADRIEFLSPGRLPGHVNVGNIARERFSRNEAIVQVLADMGMIERLGYGIKRMLRLMADWGLPRPSFEETAGGFLVTFYGRSVDVVQENEPVDRSRLVRLGLNERQMTAMEYLTKNGRITNREYRDLNADITDETARRDLAELVDKDLLLRIGDKRATYYILKQSPTG
jgi:ATP-dependent DNA helicase RecG